MAGLEDFNNIPIDPLTGLMVINGQTVNYNQMFDLLDDAVQGHVDSLKDLRDPKSDIQNLWGQKNNHFKDDWYKRVLPIRRPTGYANEFGSDDWKV